MGMKDLGEWLSKNKIPFTQDGQDTVLIDGFGRVLCDTTENVQSIFRDDQYGGVKYNSLEDVRALQEEGINHIAFPFGDNWYIHDTRAAFQLNILKHIGVRNKCVNYTHFVNLGVHTPFELLNGSFSVADWIKKAKWLGQDAVGICDENTMAGCLTFQKECLSSSVRPVFGYTLTFTDNGEKVGAKVYSQTQDGLRNLLRIQKAVGVDSNDSTIPFEELLTRLGGNVLVFGKLYAGWLLKNIERTKRLVENGTPLFFQLDLSEYKAERIDVRVLENAKAYFDNEKMLSHVPPVLIQDCYYLDKDDAKNKIILNKIATGAAHEQSDDQYFKDLDEHWETISKLFDSEKRDVRALFNAACANTVAIADGAIARFETDRNFMPEYIMTDKERARYGNRHKMFLSLLEDGFNALVPKGKEETYRSRLNHEVYVLESTDNVDYMLVQYDTVRWARENGILVGCGRGSAGGSLVLYLLGITLIDPIKYNLIFERFLLPERAGLYPSKTTVIGEDIESRDYIEAVLANGKTYKIDKDAQLAVVRGGESIVLYADELREGDDIQFDNRDAVFTLNEI